MWWRTPHTQHNMIERVLVLWAASYTHTCYFQQCNTRRALLLVPSLSLFSAIIGSLSSAGGLPHKLLCYTTTHWMVHHIISALSLSPHYSYYTGHTRSQWKLTTGCLNKENNSRLSCPYNGGAHNTTQAQPQQWITAAGRPRNSSGPGCVHWKGAPTTRATREGRGWLFVKTNIIAPWRRCTIIMMSSIHSFIQWCPTHTEAVLRHHHHHHDIMAHQHIAIILPWLHYLTGACYDWYVIMIAICCLIAPQSLLEKKLTAHTHRSPSSGWYMYTYHKSTTTQRHTTTTTTHAHRGRRKSTNTAPYGTTNITMPQPQPHNRRRATRKKGIIMLCDRHYNYCHYHLTTAQISLLVVYNSQTGQSGQKRQPNKKPQWRPTTPKGDDGLLFRTGKVCNSTSCTAGSSLHTHIYISHCFFFFFSFPLWARKTHSNGTQHNTNPMAVITWLKTWWWFRWSHIIRLSWPSTQYTHSR